MYHELVEALSVTRRHVKRLVGELVRMDVVETYGNPATLVFKTDELHHVVREDRRRPRFL